MLVVVSDTSPIRALVHVREIELLAHLFERVLIPPAVAAELENPPAKFAPVELAQIRFIAQQSPARLDRVQEFLKELDPGEAEALALAEEVRADAVLIDEAAGRAAAKGIGLQVIGTLGVLLRGKQTARVSSISPLLDRLRSELGFFISEELRRRILDQAGE